MRVKNNDKLSDVDGGLMEIVKAVEKKLGINLLASNIIRSEELNESVGGWVKSRHVDWDKDGDAGAIDFLRSSFSGSPEMLARAFYSEGATGVGIYNGHVHVDNNPNRVINPYFNDLRTQYTQYDEVKKDIEFNYFSDSYNMVLADKRKDTTNFKQLIEGVDNEMLIKIGVGVVGVLIGLGLLKDM